MTEPKDLTAEDIYARKAAARRELARLPFAEKLRIVEALRERLAPIAALRDRRRQGLGAPETRRDPAAKADRA